MSAFPASWHAAAEEISRTFDPPIPIERILDDRNAFYVQLVADAGGLAPGRKVIDLGAGICWFDPLIRKLGPEVAIIDDFGGGGGVDHDNPDPARQILDRFRSAFGIEVIEQDFLEKPLPLTDASVDVVTCFHSLEHWHNSPKNLFAEIVRVLRPGGSVVIATPNAANLRKRLHVLLGANIWSGLDEWYHEQPRFRGHVREPIVADLHRILEWNGLRVTATHGRNFIGRDSHALAFLPRPIRHGLAIAAQSVLQYVPTLCSDLHVIGRKPA